MSKIDIRMAIATILTNTGADYTIQNDVHAIDYDAMCVSFFLNNLQTSILAGLHEDLWVMSQILDDRKVTIEYRSEKSFLNDVEIEGRRSAEKRSQCDTAEVSKKTFETYQVAQYQYTQN